MREFECYDPIMVLLTDITYIPYNGTFAYLSVIPDAFTKQVLSYVLSESLEVDFVKETVEILVRDHGVDLHKETIIHSDYGVHYTSIAFIKIIKDSEIRQSMSRRGNCWDNASQESFFGHMKDHLMERIEDAKNISR
ncbi:MAG: DDE-type integrase/transposase/recombinase [Lachnospiraceae bacterium]